MIQQYLGVMNISENDAGRERVKRLIRAFLGNRVLLSGHSGSCIESVLTINSVPWFNKNRLLQIINE